MKIFAICVIKNEADIIEFTLQNAQKYADKVIVYDNGSTDGTWEIVQGLNSESIIPFMTKSGPYTDGLRAEIFNAFKKELGEDDWWVIQDGDEIYSDDPKVFIERNGQGADHIKGQKIDFCIKTDEFLEIQGYPVFQKVRDKFKFHKNFAWSETRMIRNRPGMVWKEESIWPQFLGVECDQTIKIEHYPLRSPEQAQRRWEDRQESMKQEGQYFVQWDSNSWKDLLKSQDDLSISKNTSNTFEVTSISNKYGQSLLKKLLYKFLFGFRIIK